MTEESEDFVPCWCGCVDCAAGLHCGGECGPCLEPAAYPRDRWLSVGAWDEEPEDELEEEEL